MEKTSMPWKQIIEFHREIAIRSEESFFSFRVEDKGSERFSYLKNNAIQKMQVDHRMRLDFFSNQLIFTDVEQKNTEYYIGGIFWFTNKMVEGNWIKIAHPLLYKPFNLQRDTSSETIVLEPEQAKWDISPMFYKLLDKKGIVLEGNLDEIIQELLEKAEQNSSEENFVKTFVMGFTNKFPELKKEFIENAPWGFESQWLIFVAPKDFSVIQRNLILDYSKLIQTLDESSDVLGGFELFEKHKKAKMGTVPVIPIVPLNDNQLKVVEKVISGNEITVVSGPPGCGKSQVVISILLNAWEKGQTALFASSNNQAVDVVRERMHQFEKQVPMVVRCGARKTSELMTTLDKMISIIDNYDDHQGSKKNSNEIAALEKDLKSLTELLNSNLPQRIDELARAALGAYGKAGEYRDSWEAEKKLFESRIQENGLSVEINQYEETYEAFMRWMELHQSTLDSIQRNHEERRNLQSKIDDLKSQVVEELTVDYEYLSGERLLTRDKLEEIKGWYSDYKEFLLQFLETDLQDIDWSSEYDAWKSGLETTAWIDDAEKVLVCYKILMDRYSADIAEINAKRERLKIAQSILAANGIKSINASKEEVLRQWVALYNKYLMLPKKFGDSFPFSEKKKIDKQLTAYEMCLMDSFGQNVMIEYAQEPAKRRAFISLHADEMFEEYVASQVVSDTIEKLGILQNEQKVLNSLLSAIGVPKIESILEQTECKKIIDEVEVKQRIAKEAKVAYERKERKISVIKRDRDFKFKGAQFLYLVMENIKADAGLKELFELVNGNVYNELTLELLKNARDITYQHAVQAGLNRLDKACNLWEEIDRCYVELSQIKEDAKYQLEWMDACPEEFKRIFSKMSYQSMVKTAECHKKVLNEIYEDWTNEGKATIQKLMADEQQEYDWAWDSIKKALDLCPVHILPDSKENIIAHIKEQGWDILYIKNLFSKISSEGIVIRQSRIKVALEDALLTQAVSSRMSELYNANEVKAALSKLYMDYRRTNEVISEQCVDDFITTLRALPIWITTGQSPQAIPMKPGIFDLLIIDEATQCTITSILPLIYRCKKIVVIGDMNQLPAIDNVSIAAEKFMADKFSVENYLYLLGHCGCNIYKSVLNMIPIKEGNVISLTDHYRSHPLIIGFANYYVYKNKLVLKKSMKEISDNKTTGVFGINVVGEAYKDRKTDSWCNSREADEVIRLIQSFKSIREYSNLTIGVITPFRGQVNLIYERLEKIKNTTNVFVSTVHKYQGDEKDIIIFSPVVAKGMTSGAAKWVENPQNLINVAVTRAREALYVVSDFAVCRRQPGILGSLIQYTEKIELLRKTSPYELQLFGLMMLQGWEIEVHPHIKDIEVDFIVTYLGHKVVVEVDGRQHEKQNVMDQNRDAMLAANGFDVVRIPTREIADTPFETIERIRESLKSDVF